jgi:hypothetical protein
MKENTFEAVAASLREQTFSPALRQYNEIAAYRGGNGLEAALKDSIPSGASILDKSSGANRALQVYLRVMFAEGCDLANALSVKFGEIQGDQVKSSDLRHDLDPIQLSQLLNEAWAFAGAKAADVVASKVAKNDACYGMALNEFKAKLNSGTEHKATLVAQVSREQACGYRAQNRIALEAMLTRQLENN